MAKGCFRNFAVFWRSYVLVLTPIVLSPLLFMGGTPEAKCGYGILLMAAYWVTEAMPLPVTSLLPVVIFPLFGIMSTDTACKQYLKETNMMFIGGLIVAIAVENCGLHKRIALRVLLLVGVGPKRLMLGFMLVTMFLSMWISNTATTAMMMPICEAVLEELFRTSGPTSGDSESGKGRLKDVEGVEMSQKGIFTVATCETTLYDSNEVLDDDFTDINQKPWKVEMNGNGSVGVEANSCVANHRSSSIGELTEEEQHSAKEIEEARTADKRLFRIMLTLSVAYSANIGGTGTMTGSGPNLVLKGMVQQMYGSATGLNFATWMLFGVPTMTLCLIGAWAWLMFLFTCRRSKVRQDNGQNVKKVIESKYRELGTMTFHEAAVLVLFVLIVCLWFFRDPQFIDGWALLFPDAEVDDASAAILVCIILFVVPAYLNFWCFRSASDDPAKPGPALLEWKTIQEKMPWGVVILLGGGFSMAEASKLSGLSYWVGQQLVPLKALPPELIAFIVSALTAAITEVTSNVATATVLLPVLANLSKSLEVHPLYLMFPATITCSYAFMLPIATPPNAIAFSAGKMKSKDMLLPGLVMNIFSVAVITLTINTLGVYLFDLNTFPEWAWANRSMTQSGGHNDMSTTLASAILNATMTT